MDIAVQSLKFCVLELKSDYRDKTSPTHVTTLLKGVEKFGVKCKEIAVQDR